MASDDRLSGPPSPPNRIPEEDLLADLKRVADDLGESPTAAQYNEHGAYSAQTHNNRFGSWDDAKRAAGLDTRTGGHSEYWTDEELLDSLRDLADELGRTPSINEYNAHAPHDASTLQYRFESYRDACTAAGLEPNRQPGEGADAEWTVIAVYEPEKERVRDAHAIMQDRHDESIPLHLAVAHLAELYIAEFGGRGDND